MQFHEILHVFHTSAGDDYITKRQLIFTHFLMVLRGEMKGEHLKTLEGDEKYGTKFRSGNSVGIGIDVSIVFFIVEGLWTGFSTVTNRQVL
jgi:hypothetical protein